MKRLFAVIIGIGIFVAPAHGSEYQFIKVADTAGAAFTDIFVPTISNDGIVAFRAINGASVEGIYSAPPSVTVADDTDVRFASLDQPSISNNGFVAFDAFETGGLDNGIYRGVAGDSNPAILLYDTSDTFSCVLNPSVNSSGAVVFRGESAASCASFENVPAGIYVGSGGLPTLIADNSGEFSDVGFEPRINDSGTVVFAADRVSGDIGVYTGDGGDLTTIVEGGNAYISLLGPTINCAGTVAVVAIPTTGGRAIIKGNGEPITTVVDGSSGLSDLRQASINCGETVVFIGRAPDFGPDGIYMASNGTINKVIQVGDSLDGLTIEHLTFSNTGFNDNNQIVFRAQLSDGNEYIYVANEIPDPDIDISGVVDVSGDGVPDIAELQMTGQPRVRYFSGASRTKIKTVTYLGPAWSSVAVATVADSNADGVDNDPSLAVLAEKPLEHKYVVEVRRADDGSLINKVFFLNAAWDIVDVAVIDDKNGDGVTGDTAIAVLAVNPNKPFDEQIRVQVRRLSDDKLLANWHFLNGNWTALALEAVSRLGGSPLLAVLANKATTGANVIQARRLSDGNIQRDTSFFDTSWLARDVAILTDSDGNGNKNDPAYLVLASHPETGRNKVQARRVGDGERLRNITMLGANWEGKRVTGSGDISGNLFEELGVLAEKSTDGTIAIQLKDFDDRTTTATIFP
jgi:hypothetical protein